MSFLPKNLRYLRRKRSERQSDVAIQVKKKQNTIGNWENGISEPSIRELCILSRYFEVNLEEFISADLERLDSTVFADSNPGQNFKKRKLLGEYDLNNVINSMANEAGQDQFWLIARELRKINEKLDMIHLSKGEDARIESINLAQIKDSQPSDHPVQDP